MSNPPVAQSETDGLWQSVSVDPSTLGDRAIWLAEERGLPGKVLRHFEVAGSLVRLSRYDYKLASVAFFHAVLGLEKALKLHFASGKGNLQKLLTKAVAEGLINDVGLGIVPAFSKDFAAIVRPCIKKKPDSHTVLLARIIPKLRNEYMHGEYLLAPDFLHLTLQVRSIADALIARPA